MPYRSEWQEPDLATEHKGVKVYYTYRDDDWDQGRSTYNFVTDNLASYDEAFDVRELPNWEAPPHPPFLTGRDDTPANRAAWDEYNRDEVEDKAILAALREAIENGNIPVPTPE